MAAKQIVNGEFLHRFFGQSFQFLTGHSLVLFIFQCDDGFAVLCLSHPTIEYNLSSFTGMIVFTRERIDFSLNDFCLNHVVFYPPWTGGISATSSPFFRAIGSGIYFLLTATLRVIP